MIPRSVEAICEFFDVSPLTTLYEGRKVHFLGRLTPLFYTREALSRFCNSVSGRAEINRRAAEIFPNWDERRIAWKNED